MPAGEMIGDILAVVGQVDGAAQQHLRRGEGGAAGDGATVQIDDILVAPRDMLALVHDVEADRQAVRRKLVVDVAVGAIKHHPPFGKLAALAEIQVHRLAVAAVDAFRVIAVLVADIARSPKTGSASCRERVCPYVSLRVVAVSLKKKRNTHTNKN